MYPYVRLFRVILTRSFRTKVDFHNQGEDSINLLVLPQDIDPFMELNNGRYVTLLDLGRFGYCINVNINQFLKQNKWSLTITGTYNNYRHRLRIFQRFKLKTKLLGYDEKWFYFFQKAVKNDKTYMASVVRFAFTSKNMLAIEGHINCVYDLDDFQKQLPDSANVVVRDSITDERGTRFILVGKL